MSTQPSARGWRADDSSFGSFKPKATAPEVKDCKAALRLVATDDGKIPAKPKECDPLTVTQYDAAVSDATRSKRIKATPTAP